MFVSINTCTVGKKEVGSRFLRNHRLDPTNGLNLGLELRFPTQVNANNGKKTM